MKTINHLLLGLFVAIICSNKTNAQSTIIGNFGTTTDFLGWNNNIPINFKTNGIGRMQIFIGGTTVNDGRVAFSNNLPNGFAPLDRLHSHVVGITGNNGLRFTSSGTGTTIFDGFLIDNQNDSGRVGYWNFEKHQPQIFYTNGPGNPFATLAERLRIWNGVGHTGDPNATKVSISYGGSAGYSPIITPIAMLNLGFQPQVGPPGGQRTWMDVGTFMSLNSDNMYVGEKNESGGINNANGNELTD